MNKLAFVQAKVDTEIKEKAKLVLQAKGMTISDAIKIFMTQIAKEDLSLINKIPNATSLKALEEFNTGNFKRFNTPEEMFKNLGI